VFPDPAAQPLVWLIGLTECVSDGFEWAVVLLVAANIILIGGGLVS